MSRKHSTTKPCEAPGYFDGLLWGDLRRGPPLRTGNVQLFAAESADANLWKSAPLVGFGGEVKGIGGGARRADRWFTQQLQGKPQCGPCGDASMTSPENNFHPDDRNNSLNH